MSNIPSTAISNAITPLQRADSETHRARKVQSDKEFHHAEEVEELDDTAVNSVNGGQNKEGGHGGDAESPERRDEEQVEIESLEAAAKTVAPKADPGAPHLDICA